MPAKPNLKKAREAALAGDPDAAIPVLEHFAQTDSSAAASLAEIYAFRGRWAEVIPLAAALLADPSTISAANVEDDMIRLLQRAADETKQYAEVAAAVVMKNAPSGRKKQLQALVDYCTRKGQPPHELISIFTSASAPPTRAGYDAAVKAAPTIKRLQGKPDALAAHLFGLAVSFDQPAEIVRLYPRSEAVLRFDDAVRYARAGGKDPWDAIEKKLPNWYPVDKAQVAPVVLVTDRTLAPLVTPARAELVLKTARAGR